MQAFIYITLTKSALTPYDPDLLRWVRATFPEVVIFDFDNHSAPALADYAIELIKRSDTTTIVFANSEAPEISLGSAMKLLQFMIRNKKQSIQLLLQGKHSIIEKMGKILGESGFYQTLEEEMVKERILTFFSQ